MRALLVAVRVLGHLFRLVGFLVAVPGLVAFELGDQLLDVTKRRF